AAFRTAHGLRYPLMAGAMAGGIGSEELVVELARSGSLGSFGAAGLAPERIERALTRFEREIPGLPFACNLIHSPSESGLERACVELYLARGVRCIEASAFLELTTNVVRYRVAGLSRGENGEVVVGNRVIAKVSRPEVARRFLSPPPPEKVRELLERGLVTPEQAELARTVPMADDITVEGDSGGHTDRRPLLALFPIFHRLRNRVRADQRLATATRLGAAGGLGTPEAVAAAFTLGADYVVTGSVNQACVESGTSERVRRLLCAADVADCAMAPAADMFELGVELQVLRRGTMFAQRARRLSELYRAYSGLHELPSVERSILEKQVLRRSVDEVWREVVEYFSARDPAQVERAGNDPKRKMALVFRWYLGLTSRWAVEGRQERAIDYQVWCGPSMGAFNDWVRGTYLSAPENRRVAEVSWHLLRGAAFSTRVAQLAAAGVRLPVGCRDYRPAPVLNRRSPETAVVR
ncbi:PfaD family polyunsaturated fatty acid/polyketide biosynthesis protein, partial [Actinoalloteichus spitiensis]|uniref:PfaD family polyunsaturated fatty acid/polyketide biosynthesis protein n=1 Tax=Actinoalloteichus spitiensis TaxID=252394 RepID=UPI00037BB805